ncbi:MAG: hypothetical protein ABIZ70_09980 [Gemmatimonadales bacterium]
MLAGLLALATTFGVVTTPVAPLRYKIEMKTSQEVDLSAMGQAKMTGDLGIVAFVSVMMSDSGAGQLAHVVVDSMTLTPTGTMAQQFDPSLGASAKGGFFHLYVVNGKVQGTPKPSMDGNLALTSLAQAVVILFPGNTKAGLKAGDTYSDTATTTTTSDAGTNNTSSVTTWTVKGGAGEAMMFEGVSAGKMSMDGGANAMTGTTKGARSMTSSAKGPVKTATLSNNVDVAVVPQGMSDAIPVKGVSSVTITQIN